MSGTKKEVALTSKLRAKQRRRRRNVIIGAAVAVALCAGGGGVAFAATRPTPVDYRTATAKTGDVTETVNLTGTIASVNKRNVAFQTAGTVGSVQVALGQKVTAGQVLAAMDPASLTAAATSAQQTVTKANQTLADDLASQTAVAAPTTSAAPSSSTVTSSASSSSSKSTSSSSASSSAAAAAVQAAAKAVTAAQQKLVTQYTAATTSLAATQALVTAASPTCQPFLDATVDSGSSTTSGGTTTGGTTTGGTTTAGGTTTGGTATGGTATGGTTTGSSTSADQVAAAQAALATCQSAISGVLTGQQATAAAQTELQTLASALNDSVTALNAAVQASTGGASGAASTGGAPTAATTGSATTGAAATTSAAKTASAPSGPGASPVVASAATIIADEAAVTAANAQLGIAQNNQNLGNLTSPIAGTVAAIAMTPGAAVQAGSTTEIITIIGDGGYTVSSTAALKDVTKLKVNQPVQVAVTSSSKTLAGTVSSIGLSNISTTSTTPSYTVTVAVTDKTATLLNGAAAALKVTAATATSVLTVPTSAVHRTGQTYTVDELKNGSSVTTTVKVGASGTQETEITSGLTKGTVVILADIASTTIGTATPTTTTTGKGLSGLSGSSTTTTGRTGGGGGGGRPGGAAPTGG